MHSGSGESSSESSQSQPADYAESNEAMRPISDYSAGPAIINFVGRFQYTLRNNNCEGLIDYLLNFGANFPWEVCRDALEFIPFDHINCKSAGKRLEESVSFSIINDSFLYVSLYFLFRFNVPFKLESANFLEMISYSDVNFTPKLLNSYISNMENGVYGLPPIPYDNPEFSGKAVATILYNFEEFYVDIYDSDLSINDLPIHEEMKKKGVSIKSLASGSKFICMTPSVFSIVNLSFTYCDTPSVKDFGMTPPAGSDGEDGTTGLQIARHFLNTIKD